MAVEFDYGGGAVSQTIWRIRLYEFRGIRIIQGKKTIGYCEVLFGVRNTT